MVVSSTLFLAFNVLFCFLAFNIPYWVESHDAKNASLVQWVAFGAAVFVTCMHTFHTVMLFVRKHAPVSQLMQSKFMEWYFLSGNVKYEAKIKRSALFKVDCMLNNAYDVHRQVIRYKERKRTAADDSSATFLSNFGMAVNEFSKRENIMTYCGGVHIAWRRMWNGSLFTEEGIWLSGRIIVGTGERGFASFAHINWPNLFFSRPMKFYPQLSPPPPPPCVCV